MKIITTNNYLLHYLHIKERLVFTNAEKQYIYFSIIDLDCYYFIILE